MTDYTTPGMTNGYPYPSVFQKAQKGIAKSKKSVINKQKAKKPIVKMGKKAPSLAKAKQER